MRRLSGLIGDPVGTVASPETSKLRESAGKAAVLAHIIWPLGTLWTAWWAQDDSNLHQTVMSDPGDSAKSDKADDV